MSNIATKSRITFVKKTLHKKEALFKKVLDPFFSEANMKRLDKSEQQIHDGKIIIKTMEELEAMAQ